MATTVSATMFFGVWVTRAAFVLAALGWGVGFYGPPVFLHAVISRTGWPLGLVSCAVTLHFLFGAAVVTRLPGLHQRFGVAATTVAGALATALGVMGWACATAPWQLWLAALLSGGGWVALGAAAINAIVSPWYVRQRPQALAKAYNGASIGGVVFSPLWVALIGALGFPLAAALVGGSMVAVVSALAWRVFAKTPAQLGQAADGGLPDATEPPAGAAVAATAPALRPGVPGKRLWADRRFLTLAGGMAAGLFAQIGLIAHLFSLLVPVLGATRAGLAMGLATACAIAGRSVAARAMAAGGDRRRVACASYAVQLSGALVLLASGSAQPGQVPGLALPMLLLGLVLVGSGIGNATSLPPLIAQAEFAPADVPRVVALCVAVSQATYAFAPAAFGLLLAASGGAGLAQGLALGRGTTGFFLAVAFTQALAMACLLAGRHPRSCE